VSKYTQRASSRVDKLAREIDFTRNTEDSTSAKRVRRNLARLARRAERNVGKAMCREWLDYTNGDEVAE
jgi:hypothetical protein